MLVKIIMSLVVISTFLFGDLSSVKAQDTDELCNQFCTDKEKFEGKYSSGHMKPSGGSCSEGETEEDLCCCK